MVHLLHALHHGAQTVHVRTVDTDVVVIITGQFYDLLETQPLTDIWVAFDMGRKYRFYHINAVFHVYSGCNTTSVFLVKGKKSAWRALQDYDDATETLAYLAKHPLQSLHVNSESFQKLERLAFVLYDKGSPLTSN